MSEFRFNKAGVVMPQPGDYAVISSRSQVGRLIDLGESLTGGFTMFSHTLLCTSVLADGTVMIIEAMPTGAQVVPWHYDGCDHLWSTGVLAPCPLAAEKAMRFDKWPYNWLDYVAIAAAEGHWPFAPDLVARAGRLHRVICSQLVDWAYQDAGVHLFTDGRPPGVVKPSDLAGLIMQAEAPL